MLSMKRNVYSSLHHLALLGSSFVAVRFTRVGRRFVNKTPEEQLRSGVRIYGRCAHFVTLLWHKIFKRSQDSLFFIVGLMLLQHTHTHTLVLLSL